MEEEGGIHVLFTSVHSLSDPIGKLVRTSFSELVSHRAEFICLVVNIVAADHNQPRSSPSNITDVAMYRFIVDLLFLNVSAVMGPTEEWFITNGQVRGTAALSGSI